MMGHARADSHEQTPDGDARLCLPGPPATLHPAPKEVRDEALLCIVFLASCGVRRATEAPGLGRVGARCDCDYRLSDRPRPQPLRLPHPERERNNLLRYGPGRQ